MNTHISITEVLSAHQQKVMRYLTEPDAKRLSDYLPVRLRDFWLLMHPMAQAYLFDQSRRPEEFFVLVDMEFARFEKKDMHYSWRTNNWEKNVKVEEYVITFADMKVTQSQVLLEK